MPDVQKRASLFIRLWWLGILIMVLTFPKIFQAAATSVTLVYSFVPTGSRQIKPNNAGYVLCYTIYDSISKHTSSIPNRRLNDFLVHGPHPLREDVYVPHQLGCNSEKF